MKRGTPLHKRSTVCFDNEGHIVANRSFATGGLVLIVGYTEVNYSASAEVRAEHDEAAIFSVSEHRVRM